MKYPGERDWMDEKELKTAFFTDVETTGLKASESEVLTAAWIVTDYETLAVKENQFFRFRPSFPKNWSKEAEAIHGISLEQAMEFPERKAQVEKMVAWLNTYANGFPQAFICHAYKMKSYFDWDHLFLMAFDHGLQGEWRKLFNERLIESTDTFARSLMNSGQLQVPNCKLNTLAEHFKIPLIHHDAKSDTVACFKIYKILRGM